MTIFAWIIVIIISIIMLASALVIGFRLGEAEGICKYEHDKYEYDDYYDKENDYETENNK